MIHRYTSILRCVFYIEAGTLISPEKIITRVQKVNNYIIVYLLIGIAFALLEVYFVKNKQMNKWIYQVLF